MKITLKSTETFREMHKMQHGFLSYAITAYRKDYAGASPVSLIKAIHPSIRVIADYYLDEIVIDIPDKIYTLTQIKYAGYIKQYDT